MDIVDNAHCIIKNIIENFESLYCFNNMDKMDNRIKNTDIIDLMAKLENRDNMDKMVSMDIMENGQYGQNRKFDRMSKWDKMDSIDKMVKIDSMYKLVLSSKQ